MLAIAPERLGDENRLSGMSRQHKEGIGMLNVLKRFYREDEGLEMLEWAILGAVIAMVGATAWTSLGTTLSGLVGTIDTNVAAMPTG